METVGLRPCEAGLSRSRSATLFHVVSVPLGAGFILVYWIPAVVRGNVVFVRVVFSTFRGLTCTHLVVGILATMNAGEPLTDVCVVLISTGTLTEHEVSVILRFMGRDEIAYRNIRL